MIRIENRQLISASTGPSNDLFMPRISFHSACLRDSSSTISMPAIMSARSTVAPAGTGEPGGTNWIGIGIGRDSSIGSRRDERARDAGFRQLADPALEDRQPADDLGVTITGALEIRVQVGRKLPRVDQNQPGTTALTVTVPSASTPCGFLYAWTTRPREGHRIVRATDRHIAIGHVRNGVDAGERGKNLSEIDLSSNFVPTLLHRQRRTTDRHQRAISDRDEHEPVGRVVLVNRRACPSWRMCRREHEHRERSAGSR